MKKKLLALLLALCMVLSMLPATAFAAQSPDRLTGMMVPGSVGELEPAAIKPNAKSYSVKLTGNGSGAVELLVDSPAEAGSEVYFVADPDDGYLTQIYFEGLEEDDLVYMGMDIFGFIMPDNKVTLDVQFVAAEGNSQSINIYETDGYGDFALSRKTAKPYESVLLAVAPTDNEGFDPLGYVWCSSAPVFYLFEEEGVHYYEIIVGDKPVKIFLAYKRNGPFRIAPWMAGDADGGTVTIDPEKAYVNDLVTVTIKPNPGYRVVRTQVESHAGDLVTDLTPIGNDQYTFRMHPNSVNVHVTFEAVINPITVTVDTGLGGTASVDASEAMMDSTVTLTCVPEEGYRIARITGVDNLVDNGNGVYTFTMPEKPVDLHVLFLRHENPFLDIHEKQFFYTPVLWAVEQGITSGMTDTTFGPFASCNRAQVVTFLWRAAGCPEPATTQNPFVDVPEGKWYTKAVLWAVEQNITSGITDVTFVPDGVSIRAQVVTFLWRAYGSPEPETTENPFVDVPETSFYYKAVLWALENGITTGTDATHFNPGGQCQRGQVVTFLWRAAQLPVYHDLHWVINGFQDTPSDYGTVTLSHTSAAEGEIITATVIPAEGYTISWVKCENGTPITQVSETEYTFVMPDHPENFHVNFEAVSEPEPDPEPAKTYELVLKYEGSGRIAYAGETKAAAGESLFFYAVPDEGWYLSQFTIFDPNNDIGNVLVYAHDNNMYEIVMPDRDAILTAIFLPIEG